MKRRCTFLKIPPKQLPSGDREPDLGTLRQRARAVGHGGGAGGDVAAPRLAIVALQVDCPVLLFIISKGRLGGWLGFSVVSHYRFWFCFHAWNFFFFKSDHAIY